MVFFQVSTSLEKIESQMQSFWKKLNEIEISNRKNDQNECSILKPPEVKPRSKFTLKNETNSRQIEVSLPKEPIQNAETPLPEYSNEEILQKSTSNDNLLKKNSEEESISLMSSEIETTPSAEVSSIIPPKTETIKKGNFNPNNVIDEDLLKHFKKEVEKIIIERLQNLGVAPDWKGLPLKSFQKALEIVNHQSNLMKKV